VNPSTHVLIVEDLDFWQDALSEVLIDAGYQVCTAASYAEALDVLARNRFHLVVIDPVLDDANRRNRDGLRVLQHVLDQQPDMCTVVVTASDPHHIRREVGEISANTPLLFKDRWDDNRFLDVVEALMSEKQEPQTVLRED
jgi:DNA-binding NtrC family response regulator